MATQTDFKSGLGDADDAPALSPPDIPTWTENLFWVAFDKKNGIGMAVHLGSTRHDFNVVRQSIIISLPDGRLVSDVSVGGFREGRKVRGATLAFECVDPFREWRITSNGVGQIAPLAEMWNNSPRQGPRVPVQLDIKGECLGPVWVAGADENVEQMQQQEWASSHYQQTIRLQGKLDIDGVHYEFDATGWRDHSRGPRDFSNWTGHALFSAPFASGRSFGLMSVFGPGGKTVYRSAYVVRDGVMERGVPRPVAPLSQNFLGSESGTIELEIGDRVEKISFRTHGGFVLSMLAPYDVTPGIYRDSPGGIALSEAMATVTWDGETSCGVLERSALAATLAPVPLP